MPQKTSGMTAEEVARVLEVLLRRAGSTRHGRENEMIFRLAISSLHASEICRLRIADLTVNKWPAIRVDDIDLPIFDMATAERFRVHIEYRTDHGAGLSDLFLTKKSGLPFRREEISRRFKTCVSCLGRKRQSELSVRSGRQTAATLLQARGCDVPTLQLFLRHQRREATLRYLQGGTGDLKSLYDLPKTRNDELAVREARTTEDSDRRLESELLDIALSLPDVVHLDYRSFCSARMRLVNAGFWDFARADNSKCLRILRHFGLSDDRDWCRAVAWMWVLRSYLGEELRLSYSPAECTRG